jgi:probable rRNA maturation factor
VSELVIRNRQRTRALNVPLLRRIIRHVLEKELNVASYELGFHFVPPGEMARVNDQFLQHEGSTDVITFDHGGSARRWHGEIFICIADAVKQAQEFRTTWQSEVVRYVIHGALHLRGYDDLQPAKRRVMKREENRLVKRVASQFALARLVRTRNTKLKTRNTR